MASSALAAVPDALAARDGTCRNCGAERTGPYCARCGQHALEGDRLTPRILWREFNQRFLHLEHGLFLTIRELTTDPGGLIRRYLAGERKRYVNPLGFLVIAVAFNLAVHALSGYEERALSQMLDSSSGAELGMTFEESMREFMRWSFDHLSFLTVLICVFFAGFLRLFLGKQQINTAEGLVFGLFCYGQVTIIGTLLEIPYIFARDLPYSLQVETMLDFGLLFALILFAGWGLFRRVGPTVLTALSLAGGFLVYFALQIVMMVGFVAFVMITSGERAWTLHEAVAQNRLSIVQTLLDEGADPDALTGQTPLHRAVETGQEEVAALLLDRGATIDAPDAQGRTPLLLALHLQQTALAERLLDAGADPNRPDTSGTTPLMEAVSHNQRALARRLLAGGADPDAVRSGSEYATALMIAAGKRRSGPTYVALLLDAGADPRLTNADGQTALDLARHDDARALLRAALSPPRDGLR